MNEEKKQYAKKVINPDRIKGIFDEGAVWKSTDRNDPNKHYLGMVNITLKPGTYEVQEGDTLQLIGFLNDYRTDKETGVVNEKAPHYKLRVKRPRGENGGKTGGY